MKPTTAEPKPKTPALNATGNWRKTQTVGSDHGVRYIQKSEAAGEGDGGLGAATIFLACLCFILLAVCLYCTLKYNATESAKFEAEKARLAAAEE